MNKTTLLAAVGIVILVIICGAYFFLHKGEKSSLTASQKEQSEKMVGQPKSLTDFLAMTGSQKCTFDTQTGSTGTIYVGDGKMSGEFHSDMNGKHMNSHMIDDKDYMYIWTDDTNQGYKITISALKEMIKDAASGNNQTSTPIDLNQKADYSCDSWNVDSSVFNIPKTISFKDYTATMEHMMQAPTNMSGNNSGTNNQAACKACSQLSGSAQAQCRTALKCQ